MGRYYLSALTLNILLRAKRACLRGVPVEFSRVSVGEIILVFTVPQHGRSNDH